MIMKDEFKKGGNLQPLGVFDVFMPCFSVGRGGARYYWYCRVVGVI